jgi:hypothetical protein
MYATGTSIERPVALSPAQSARRVPFILSSIDEINRAADSEPRLPDIGQIEREADEGLDLPSVCEILGTCGGSSGGSHPSGGYP